MSEIHSIIEQARATQVTQGYPPDAEFTPDDWLDQWLIASGDPLKALVASIQERLIEHQVSSSPRLRKRRPEDQRTFERMVEMAVCNLVSCALRANTKGAVAYRRATSNTKKTRYMDPLFSVRVFNTVIDGLEPISVARSIKGAFDQKRTSTFAPSGAFIESLSDLGVTLAHLGRSEHEEVIFLTMSVPGLKSQKGTVSYGRTRHWIDYTDTEESIRCRGELRMYNKYCYRGADITFLEDGLWPKVDTTALTLRRYFITLEAGEERFDLHGRIYGPWWIHLKKDRRANIRVQGEPPVDLDYAQMFPRLLYAREDRLPPPGDLYDLTGILSGYVHQEHRKVVKQVFNAMLFSGACKLPWGTVGLPFGTTMTVLKAALAEKHPAIAHHFGDREIGFRLMMMESRIMMGILGDLLKKRIMVLPVHDGLMVARSREDEATKAMRDNAVHYTGYDIPVEKKPIRGLEDQTDTNPETVTSALDL
jgi:hypothetical protein